MIGREFKDKTLLVIAHRLSTVIGYDRMLVMEDCMVNVFGSPDELWEQGSLFREMYENSGIGKGELCKVREEL